MSDTSRFKPIPGMPMPPQWMLEQIAAAFPVCAECGKEIRHGARGLCLKCFVEAMPTEARGCDCAWICDRLVRGRCHE